jgi:ABC-type amino acid transport substrate-binding protein
MRYIFFIIFLHVTLFASAVELNDQERTWLKTHKKIVVGIDNNFAPFEYVDNDGSLKGVSADYLKELSKILNVSFEIVKDKDWVSLNEMAKEKKIDIFTCIVPTKERKEYLNFTKPYFSFPMVIVTNINSGFINSLEELNGKTVAVIDNYTPHQLLQRFYPKIHLVKTKNLKQALELVASGKTFAHVGNLPRVIHQLKKDGFQNLSITGITDFTYDFSIGIRKDDPILNSIVKKAFNAITQSKHEEIYDKWFKINYHEPKSSSVPTYIIAIILVVLTILLMILYGYTREIRTRRANEEQFRKNIDWLNRSLKIKCHYLSRQLFESLSSNL